MLKASDIMRTEVVTVPLEMTVEELGRLFIEKDLSGAPVVAPDGRLIGIVTENDLISRNKRLHIPTMLRLFDAFIPLEGFKSVEKEIKKMSSALVSDICTRDVITISEDAPIDEIATIMSEKKVHLLPVIKSGRLAGIVGKHELIKGIAR